jgi:hypothetical protein
VLPQPIRERLWALIERQPAEGQARPPQEVAAEMLRSHQSLLLRLGVAEERGIGVDSVGRDSILQADFPSAQRR